MASEPISLRGVILRSGEFKDKDRIITFLSSEAGVINICVKGSGKQGSKLLSATIPFMVCDIVVSMTGNYYYLKEFSIVYSNSEIMNSLEAMTCAAHIGQLLSTSYIDNTNSKVMYELCVYTYFALSKTPEDHLLIFSAFNWRFLYLLGYCILYEICNTCDKELKTAAYLSYSTGDAHCVECYGEGRTFEEMMLMSSAGIKALNYFIQSDIKKLFMIKVDYNTLKMLSLYTTRCLDIQLEGTYDSYLDLLRDLNL
ncbi:MAG: DNA repair protein RecO [Clostridia bacterium]|nr:DNA repair protein RecO [Clostridia bacterium]